MVRVRAGPERDGRQTLMALTPKRLKWFWDGRAAKQDWLTVTISQKVSIREQEKARARPSNYWRGLLRNSLLREFIQRTSRPLSIP